MIQESLIEAIRRGLASESGGPTAERGRDIVAFVLPPADIGLVDLHCGLARLVPSRDHSLNSLMEAIDSRSDWDAFTTACLASELSWRGVTSPHETPTAEAVAVQQFAACVSVDVLHTAAAASRVPDGLRERLARDFSAWAHELTNRLNAVGLMSVLAAQGSLRTRQLAFLSGVRRDLDEWLQNLRQRRVWVAHCYREPLEDLWQSWTALSEAMTRVEQVESFTDAVAVKMIVAIRTAMTNCLGKVTTLMEQITRPEDRR